MLIRGQTHVLIEGAGGEDRFRDSDETTGDSGEELPVVPR